MAKQKTVATGNAALGSTPCGGKGPKETPVNFELTFSDENIIEDRKLVFGWASVIETADGEEVVDSHEHIIEEIELEEAVYTFVRHGGFGSEMHVNLYVATVVESMVFTKEKMERLGIPPGTLPVGWWIGMFVYDDEVFEKIKSGVYNMFSIAGRAVIEDVDVEEEDTDSTE